MESTLQRARRIWRFTFNMILPFKSQESDDDLESGQGYGLSEKTPLISPASQDAKQNEDGYQHENEQDEVDSPATWQRQTRGLSLVDILYSVMMAMLYSVLVFLPMLPFWIFAGFLVYLLGSATGQNFYLYCSVLTVIIPFNVVGTLAIVRGVWQDSVTTETQRR